MARGESEANERSTAGMVIGAVFAVACLGALLVVVSVDRDPPPPPPPTALAPFPGAYGVLASLRWRDCPPDSSSQSWAARLRPRGFVAHGSEDLAHRRDLQSGLEAGACGVIVVQGTAVSYPSECGEPNAGAWAACGDVVLPVDGDGAVTVERWVHPDLPPPDDAAPPLELMLAQTEAAHLLAAHGFEAATDAWFGHVDGSGQLALPLPAPPTAGCRALVFAIRGPVERVHVRYEGAERVRSASTADSLHPGRVLVGAPQCAGSSGEPSIVAIPSDGHEVRLEVLLRSYAPPTGPGASVPPVRSFGVVADLDAAVPAR